MLQEIWEALAPSVLEAVAALVTLMLGWATMTLKRKWGIDIEARHREALHSAIMTGVRLGMDGKLTPSEIIAQAVAYARQSVPDAIRGLGATEGVLADLALAKMRS